MKRSQFLKRSSLALAGLGLVPASLRSASSPDHTSTYDRLREQVGFNHLPSAPKDMNKLFIPADSRGKANHGWLQANHSFSFANYYDPQRMHFGVLRVLNDDHIAGGGGFGTHPHDNMEIITIPLEGDLAHKDSMGNSAVIQAGEVQVMSAGTGIQHSEFNAHKDRPVKLFQIWLFPNRKNVSPRYDQIKLDVAKQKNQFAQILSPSAEDEGVWIHQEAWFHLGDFEAAAQSQYRLKKPQSNGLFTMVIGGRHLVNGEELGPRDGLGLWDISEAKYQCLEPGKVLLMEVPMQLG